MDEHPKSQSITKTALTVTLFVAISRVFGFVREAVIAAVFGMGAVTDAYAVAFRVVTTAGLIVSVYLTTTFVPSYIRTKEEQGEEKALRFANNALGVALAINLLLMGILQLGAPLILRLITGFDGEQMSMAVLAVSIALFQLPVLTFVNFFSGYFNARKKFIAPSLVGIPMNVGFITICLVAGTASGIVGLSAAALLSAAAPLAVYVFWLKKENYRYQFSMRFNTPEMHRDIAILLPALIGVALWDLKAWVDTTIATHMGEGYAAAINFSTRLLGFVNGLVIIPIAGIIFSYMSEYATKKDTAKMLETLWSTARTILFLVIPIVVISMPMSFDIVSIVFERGRFTPDDTLLTGAALRFYMPGLLGAALYTFLIRFFYGLQDTKTPMFCGIVAMLANIGLSLWLSSAMGIGGLALATSVGNSIAALLLLIFLRKKLGHLGFLKTAKDIAKMLVCAVPCAVAVLGIDYFMSGYNSFIRFGTGIFVGTAGYLACAVLLRVTVLKDIIAMLKSRRKAKEEVPDGRL